MTTLAQSYIDRGPAISAALMGHSVSAETRQAISRAHTGRPKKRCEPGCTCGKHKGTQGRSLNKAKGYWVLTGIVHPLTGSGELSGRAFEHRVVLWNTLGCNSLDCAHPCHWCGKTLTWVNLKADHLDGDRLNNDPANLVPSCNGCNIKRGWRRKADA